MYVCNVPLGLCTSTYIRAKSTPLSITCYRNSFDRASEMGATEESHVEVTKVSRIIVLSSKSREKIMSSAVQIRLQL